MIGEAGHYCTFYSLRFHAQSSFHILLFLARLWTNIRSKFREFHGRTLQAVVRRDYTTATFCSRLGSIYYAIWAILHVNLTNVNTVAGIHPAMRRKRDWKAKFARTFKCFHETRELTRGYLMIQCGHVS